MGWRDELRAKIAGLKAKDWEDVPIVVPSYDAGEAPEGLVCREKQAVEVSVGADELAGKFHEIGPAVGRVNGREFCGAAAGTLMLTGASESAGRGRLNFMLSNPRWNLFVLPGGEWGEATVNGKPPFDAFDFSRLGEPVTEGAKS